MSEQWNYFLDLNDSRSSNGYGYNPISYSDILAYFQLQEIAPRIWEVNLIRKLDRVVLNVYSERAKRETEKAKRKS